MIANIAEQENHVVHFVPILGETLFVENVGYNHFRYLQGIRLRRKQSYSTIHIVLSGRGWLFMGGKEYDLKKGDVFVCPPNETFAYWPNETDPWEYVWLAASGENATDGLLMCGFSVESPCLFNRADHRMLALINDLFFSVEENVKSAYKATSVWLELLYQLCQKNTLVKKRTNAAQKHADRAAECIRQNYSNPDFNISHIGHLIYVSHSYLCRAFLATMGKTLMCFLIDTRMSAAQKKLLETDNSVKEIALSCGYGDYSHFCKTFFRLFGTTPKSFREKVSAS